MPRAKKRRAVDLSKLADDTNDALGYLFAEGYTQQVDLIREFITAQGETFREQIKIQRDVNNDLAKKAKIVQRQEAIGE